MRLHSRCRCRDPPAASASAPSSSPAAAPSPPPPPLPSLLPPPHFVPEHFMFKLESRGALAPEQIVQSALRELVRKMGELRAAASDLTGGGR